MKKTLLMAAATLAAGIISTQATGVYSQNIVGYANVAAPTAGANYFISVPFSIGSSNGANEVFSAGLPSGTDLDIWNGSGFTTYIYDTSDPVGLGTNVVWYNSDDQTPAIIPVLPVGQAFLLVPAAPITNTFAGTVAVTVGTSNNMVLATAGKNYFVGCAVPYAGYVTNGNSSTGGPNLNNLPSGTDLDFWNGNGFTTIIYDTSDPVGLGTNVVWYASDDQTPVACPAITVGQGFLIVPGGSYTWTTGL
jgi:hypothetical protein